jgi:hypothetical protein
MMLACLQISILKALYDILCPQCGIGFYCWVLFVASMAMEERIFLTVDECYH